MNFNFYFLLGAFCFIDDREMCVAKFLKLVIFGLSEVNFCTNVMFFKHIRISGCLVERQ